MIRKLGILFSLLLFNVCEAFCPLCVVAAGAGIGLSQHLGIDDLIVGLWVGGITVGLIALTVKLSILKGVKYSKVWVTSLYYISLYYFLDKYELIGHELNRLWGVDRLILGIIVGSFVFYGMYVLYLRMKSFNKNKPYFPYQKVVMPVGGLVIFSIIGYFL